MFDKDYEKESHKIQAFLQNTVAHTGFEKIIVALSGGIDSSVVLTLCVRAFGVENVLIAMLPYGSDSLESKEKAYIVTGHLKIPKKNRLKIDIKPAVDAIMSRDKYINKIRKGNIMARTRMIYLYDLAKQHKVFVVGTENRSEYLLGYFTRFGDEASDIEPLRHLYKTEVIAMARILGLPEKIIASPPTADLWEGQTDEGELGFSYEVADKVLHFHFDEKLPFEKIVKHGFNKEVVAKVLLRVKQNEFKHKTPISLGKN